LNIIRNYGLELSKSLKLLESWLTFSGFVKKNYICFQFCIKSGNEFKMYYTYTDNLGSITTITDEDGNIVQSNRFGAWGEPMDYTGNGTSNMQHDITDRGYTGHEHLTEFRLINMNGRLYDPQLGRMLSPDNYLQSPDNTQNFNRYSYVLNNPLKYTDPSGEIVLALLRGVFEAVWSGGMEFWNWNEDYTKNAWAKADPFNPGTAGNNSARIWGGLFQGTTNQTVSRFTKEIPQTTLGFIFAHATNLFTDVNNVTYYNGATLVNRRVENDGWSGMTVGSYILGKNLETSINTSSTYNERRGYYMFAHEYGHYIQSQENGLMYLPKFAIPSLFDQIFDNLGMRNHDNYWVEQDANSRAFDYFTGTTGSRNGTITPIAPSFNQTDFILGPERRVGVRPPGHGNLIGNERNATTLDKIAMVTPFWYFVPVISFFE